mmetsp:Transcript_40746/g.79941  ORF Transcript_40746/g.79941 Transcript_40746/m.79941 type:complete len:141 (+) Transcript_40746:70-492(+)
MILKKPPTGAEEARYGASFAQAPPSEPCFGAYSLLLKIFLSALVDPTWQLVGLLVIRTYLQLASSTRIRTHTKRLFVSFSALPVCTSLPTRTRGSPQHVQSLCQCKVPFNYMNPVNIHMPVYCHTLVQRQALIFWSFFGG